jgi:hypothetical protein
MSLPGTPSSRPCALAKTRAHARKHCLFSRFERRIPCPIMFWIFIAHSRVRLPTTRIPRSVYSPYFLTLSKLTSNPFTLRPAAPFAKYSSRLNQLAGRLIMRMLLCSRPANRGLTSATGIISRSPGPRFAPKFTLFRSPPPDS